MNKIFRLFLFFGLWFLSLTSYSQSDFCGFDSLMLSWKNSDPASYSASHAAHHANVAIYRATHPNINYIIPIGLDSTYNLSGGNGCPQVNYILPVVVHVIHLVADASPGIGTNIRDSQVDSQMLALNRAFANYGGTSINTGIQFCLATKKPDGSSFNGITRTGSNKSITRRQQLDSLIKLIQYPTDRYINIYVVSTILDSAGNDNGILGYASYPYSTSRKKDALVIRHDWFGIYNGGSPLSALADGKVLVHEMGHYLGLYHPFEGGCSGLTSTDCHTSGDLCCDVPAVSGQNTSCSTQNTCTETPSSRDLFDQKENYMDYTNPSCKNKFTPDQANIMYSVLENTRSSLWDPKNINKLSLSCCMNNAKFSGLDFGCKTDSVYYNAYLYDSATYTWSLFKNKSLLSTYNTTNEKLQLKLDTGYYELELQIDATGGRFTYRFPHTIHIVDCSNPIHSTRGNWYFGQYSGIRFYNGGKVFRDVNPYNLYRGGASQINAYEGTLSMSDTAGKMVFYGGTNITGNDIVLYDKNYLQMTGNPVDGYYSSAQGMISIQHSKKPYIHYLFHIASSSPRLKYSKIDLSKTSSTIGELLNKNTVITDSGGVALNDVDEGITALSGCNDSTYWIIVHRYSPMAILIYQFINGNLTYHSSFSPYTPFSEDRIRFSPNGNMFSYGRYICSFDRSNAQIKILHQDTGIGHVYDAVFSQDSKLLYRSESTYANLYSFKLYQIDLESKDPNLGKVIINTNKSFRQSLQMGPDGKIYVTNYNSKYLSAINNPSNRQYSGNNCGYTEVGVTLGSDGQDINCWEGFPNFIDAKDQTLLGPDFLSRPTACKTIEFLSNQCCQSTYKWYFGDGDSSTSKNPSHTYADTGNYIVTMKAGILTKTDTIRIGIPKRDLKISGDTFLCQSGSVRQYSTVLNPNYISYTWKPVGHSSAYFDKNRAEIYWSTNGSLGLVVTDKNGCIDSSSVSITQAATNITNNTIPSNVAVCDTSFNYTINGSTPSGGSGSLTYRWFYKDQNGSTQIISGATSKDYVATHFPYSTQIQREVSQNGCHHISNILTLTILANTNKITQTQIPCFKGKSFIVLGDTTYGALSNTINWEYSTNNSSWSSYSIQTQNINTPLIHDSIYVRRKIDYSGYCEITSNVIKIVPDMIITLQPKTAKVCKSNGGSDISNQARFSVIVKNRKGYTFYYSYNFKDWNPLTNSYPATWGGSPASQTNSSLLKYYQEKSRSEITIGDSIMFTFQTPCGNFTSNKVLFITDTTHTPITLHPSNRNIDEGDTIVLHGNVAGSDPYLRFRWQLKSGSGGVYQTLGGGNPDSIYTKKDLIIKANDYCTDGLYRFITMGVCPVYSNPAQVTMIRKSDLWMQDSQKDTGAEPNRFIASKSDPKQRTLDLFMSPDLYNCKNNPNCNQHEGAEYKQYSHNYVRYKIRNKGSDTSKPANLFLYWTMASTGEVWKKAWEYNLTDNGFYNADFNETYPKGGEINKRQNGILIPINVPQIAPGDSFSSSYPWDPPNPQRYYTWVGGNKSYYKTLNVCLLARIEYCSIYPHKMKFDELFNVAVDTNIINNNNIVTRNLWVVDDVINNTPWAGRERKVSWTNIYQRHESPGPITIHIDATNPIFDPNIRVVVTLDDSLWQAWLEGGLVGSGFTTLDSQRIELTDVNATLGNIYSDSMFLGKIGVEFLLLDTNIIPADTSFYTVSQTFDEDASFDGGVVFQVDFNNVAYEVGEDGGGANPKAEILKMQKNNEMGYLIYPNPANTRLNVYIKAEQNSNHIIQITDPTGKILISENCNLKQTESCAKQIDISHLAVGTYFVCLSSDNRTEVKRINILR